MQKISLVKFNQWMGVCLIAICSSCEPCPVTTFGPCVAVTGHRHMFEAGIIWLTGCWLRHSETNIKPSSENWKSHPLHIRAQREIALQTRMKTHRSKVTTLASKGTVLRNWLSRSEHATLMCSSTKRLIYTSALQQWFQNFFTSRTPKLTQSRPPFIKILSHSPPSYLILNFCFYVFYGRVYEIHDQHGHTFCHCVTYGWKTSEN